MSSIITAENLSKRFIIAHEQRENYTLLSNVVSSKVKHLFSFGRSQAAKSETEEEFWALKDISFEINQGDRVGIIGRNGAGKSTLLKVLSRITEPTAGRVTIDGRVASLLEVGTGFHQELTGRENIFLNGAILGMSRAEIRKKFDEIVAFAEVEKFLDTPVKRYSSGMYVRLAFAVAAHLEPEILIVDEVLAVGDAQFQKKCLGKMEDVSKNEGRTVLFVSHNMGVIAQLCQKAIFLQKGTVSSNGSATDVINEYIKSSNTFGADYELTDFFGIQKVNFFTKIYSANSEGQKSNDFSFNENIVLNFEFQLRDKSSDIQIGIGLNDKYQNRIFTILKPIDFFNATNESSYKGRVTIPGNIIAPNQYSFAFAIWTKSRKIYDSVDNVNIIKIHDTGTDLSLYSDIDYGSVIINPEWSNA